MLSSYQMNMIDKKVQKGFAVLKWIVIVVGVNAGITAALFAFFFVSQWYDGHRVVFQAPITFQAPIKVVERTTVPKNTHQAAQVTPQPKKQSYTKVGNEVVLDLTKTPSH